MKSSFGTSGIFSARGEVVISYAPVPTAVAIVILQNIFMGNSPFLMGNIWDTGIHDKL